MNMNMNMNMEISNIRCALLILSTKIVLISLLIALLLTCYTEEYQEPTHLMEIYEFPRCLRTSLGPISAVGCSSTVEK